MSMNILSLGIEELKDLISKEKIFYTFHDTPAGKLIVLATRQGIFEAKFIGEIKYFINYEFNPDIDLNNIILSGTDFQISTYKALLNIKSGTTLSYQGLAKILKVPKAYRAVATALAQNKIAYFVPCHRVINKNGTLGGYRWGVDRKLELIKSEKELSVSEGREFNQNFHFPPLLAMR